MVTKSRCLEGLQALNYLLHMIDLFCQAWGFGILTDSNNLELRDNQKAFSQWWSLCAAIFFTKISIVIILIVCLMFYQCYNCIYPPEIPPPQPSREVMDRQRRAEEVIAFLQMIKTEQQAPVNEAESCVICFNGYEEGQAIVELRCGRRANAAASDVNSGGHKFHLNCME